MSVDQLSMSLKDGARGRNSPGKQRPHEPAVELLFDLLARLIAQEHVRESRSRKSYVPGAEAIGASSSRTP
jgi:hypothetical protein